MSDTTHLSRRRLLKVGAVGAVGVGALSVPLGRAASGKQASKLATANFPRPYQVAFIRPPVLQPTSSTVDGDGIRTNFYTVTEMQGTAQIAPGLTTPVWAYNGSVPGPTISLEQGTKAVLKVRNQLPGTHPQFGHAFDTSTHLHGSASLPQYDGYASDITPPQYVKDYQYPNFQAARTLWYHDHGVHFTAQNAYGGLAAQYHLHDPVERALLPQGEFDVPITISDAQFAADGKLSYDDHTESGLWGDVILVNGRPWPVMQVKRRVYRFRILNASISRSYRPRLGAGDPMTVVATDGGLMPAAKTVTSYRHGNAERYEILIDFSRYPVGKRVELTNLSNTNNIDYDNTGKIMAFDVVDGPFDTTNNTIPTTLASSPVMSLTAAQAVRTRQMAVERTAAGEWSISGKTWHDVIDSGYNLTIANPALNDVEIWEIQNRSGGWFHPVHIHLVDFQILNRKLGSANPIAPYDYEKGPKDVVYIGENETVKVLMRFEHQRGKYMMHCHNLPHEDHDMMQQFSVGLQSPDPNDPINADPARPDVP
jgi:spore coat protein A, manganese oxidase